MVYMYICDNMIISDCSPPRSSFGIFCSVICLCDVVNSQAKGSYVVNRLAVLCSSGWLAVSVDERAAQHMDGTLSTDEAGVDWMTDRFGGRLGER